MEPLLARIKSWRRTAKAVPTHWASTNTCGIYGKSSPLSEILTELVCTPVKLERTSLLFGHNKGSNNGGYDGTRD